MSDAATRTREIIAEHLGRDLSLVTDDAEMKDDLDADSLDSIEIAMALEEEFNLGEIGDGEVERWKTVGDLVRTVEGLV